MRFRRQAYLSSAALCAILMASLGTGATAQTVAVAGAGGDGVALEELVVTARKREEIGRAHV